MGLAAPGRRAACLAVFGTGSDVGKSVFAAALCRIYADRGLRVAPFKAQNMSNNSGVTPGGLEMGRAQIVQAEAARVAPHVDMNPVLLKPTSDIGAQVVVMGRPWLDASAKTYDIRKQELFDTACKALDRLRAVNDLVILEGAGSCAEMNLLARDIVNLPMAAYAGAPVILVADIHRGGVFAQILGTLECLAPEQRDQIKGVVINRFRGDIELFRDGVSWIETRIQPPVLGVLPWFSHFTIAAEDAVAIERPEQRRLKDAAWPTIGVIRLPHLSNFDEFDPLDEVRGVNLAFLEHPRNLADFKAVIVPGSKSTRSDLDWMQRTGWADRLRRYAAAGGHVLGVCGGYQMLGRWVHDPGGLEGPPGSSRGLELLPVETELKAPKTTTRTRFAWEEVEGDGYEIHMGQTIRCAGRFLFAVRSRNGAGCKDEDGCVSEDGRVLGTYLHGIFDTPAVIRRWLAGLGLPDPKITRVHGPAARDHAYDQLAAHTAQHIDLDGIDRIIGLAPPRFETSL
ncbi:MAG: cobyric acid synthase [Desulfosarcinaceae bacterium]